MFSLNWVRMYSHELLSRAVEKHVTYTACLHHLVKLHHIQVRRITISLVTICVSVHYHKSRTFRYKTFHTINICNKFITHQISQQQSVCSLQQWHLCNIASQVCTSTKYVACAGQIHQLHNHGCVLNTANVTFHYKSKCLLACPANIKPNCPGWLVAITVWGRDLSRSSMIPFAV